MRSSITQAHPFGCGVACFAFVCDLSIEAAEQFLGHKQARSSSFWLRDFVSELNRFGLGYKHRYVKRNASPVFIDGSIVLLRSSSRYPAGHYLVRYKGMWMDPHINSASDPGFRRPKSGWRSRLPGQVMYIIEPLD